MNNYLCFNFQLYLNCKDFGLCSVCISNRSNPLGIFNNCLYPSVSASCFVLAIDNKRNRSLNNLLW